MRLTFSMFFPCDEDDKPMDPPVQCTCENGDYCKVPCEGGEYASSYKEAMSKVIFEGDFDYSDPWFKVMINDGEPTIEYLAEMESEVVYNLD